MPLFDIILEMISCLVLILLLLFCVQFQFISQGAVTEACMVYITRIYLKKTQTHYLYPHHLAHAYVSVTLATFLQAIIVLSPLGAVAF